MKGKAFVEKLWGWETFRRAHGIATHCIMTSALFSYFGNVVRGFHECKVLLYPPKWVFTSLLQEAWALWKPVSEVMDCVKERYNCFYSNTAPISRLSCEQSLSIRRHVSTLPRKVRFTVHYFADRDVFQIVAVLFHTPLTPVYPLTVYPLTGIDTACHKRHLNSIKSKYADMSRNVQRSV